MCISSPPVLAPANPELKSPFVPRAASLLSVTLLQEALAFTYPREPRELLWSSSTSPDVSPTAGLSQACDRRHWAP